MLIVLGIGNHFYFMTFFFSGLNSASLNVFQIYKDRTLRKCNVFINCSFLFKPCCTYDTVLVEYSIFAAKLTSNICKCYLLLMM